MVLTFREFFLALALFVLDQVTKAIARATQPQSGLFELTHNTGAGFGILQGNNAILLVISLVVLVFVIKQATASQGMERTAYIALSAGIVGNSVDRIIFGAVTDFIAIGTFPVFNVADSLITLSILYLVAAGLSGSFRSWNFKRKGTRKK